MKLPCNCCKGLSVLTPLDTYNAPGQSRLRYRAGTHASFLASMGARLSSADYPELAGLTTRDPSDPSLAMLDVWATVADVLTFYQERIANEGYLRTATERLSVLELAGHVGYTLKPGVAASVYLAYMLEKGYAAEVPAGQRAQSLPAAGELPQSFETAEPLKAHSDWNELRPRMTRPQNIKLENGALSENRIFFQGTANNLKAGDVLLLVFGDTGSDRTVCVISAVNIHAAEDRTECILSGSSAAKYMMSASSMDRASVTMASVFSRLSLLPAVQPMGSRALQRDIGTAVASKSDVVPQMITRMTPAASFAFYKAFGSMVYCTTPRPLKAVYVLRTRAALFGYNAPRSPPHAAFAMTPDPDSENIFGSTQVKFTDESTGPPTSWHWNFGNGRTADVKDPPGITFTPGTYTVTLTVTNERGSSTAARTFGVFGPVID